VYLICPYTGCTTRTPTPRPSRASRDRRRRGPIRNVLDFRARLSASFSSRRIARGASVQKKNKKTKKKPGAAKIELARIGSHMLENVRHGLRRESGRPPGRGPAVATIDTIGSRRRDRTAMSCTSTAEIGVRIAHDQCAVYRPWQLWTALLVVPPAPAGLYHDRFPDTLRQRLGDERAAISVPRRRQSRRSCRIGRSGHSFADAWAIGRPIMAISAKSQPWWDDCLVNVLGMKKQLSHSIMPAPHAVTV